MPSSPYERGRLPSTIPTMTDSTLKPDQSQSTTSAGCNDTPFAFTLLDRLSPETVSNSRGIGINRESSPNNRHAHATKEAVLRKAYTQFAPTQYLECCRFTGSGNLRILRDNDFNSVDVEKSYFGWLRNTIEGELQCTSPEQMLYIFTLCPDRLFRSIRFDRHKDHWDLHPEDFVLFAKWLRSCYPNDYERIVFVDCSNGMTPEQCRVWQTELGQAGKKGGRPRRQRQYKKDYYDKAVRLATDRQWNATQVLGYLKKHYAIVISDRAVRKWLREGNASAKIGRPSYTKNGTFIRPDSSAIPSSRCIYRDSNDVSEPSGLNETLCNSSTSTSTRTTIIPYCLPYVSPTITVSTEDGIRGSSTDKF